MPYEPTSAEKSITVSGPPPPPPPLPPVNWEAVASSALIGVLVGSLGYIASRRAWVGAASGAATGALTYFLLTRAVWS